MLITGQHPAGLSFLMLVYLLEIDLPLVALMPFWSLPYLPIARNKSPTTPHLHQVPHPRQPSRGVHRVQELMTLINVNKREIHLFKVEYRTVKIHSLDTNKRPQENNTRFFTSA